MIDITFFDSLDEQDNVIKNTVTVRAEYKMSKQLYDDLNNGGAIRPDKKDCVQETTTKDGKAMCKLPAKDVRETGTRERKNIIDDERAES
jgi:hypothetical protein